MGAGFFLMSIIMNGTLSEVKAAVPQPQAVTEVPSEVLFSPHDAPPRVQEVQGAPVISGSVHSKKRRSSERRRFRETEAEGMEAPRQFQSNVKSDISLKSQYKFQGQSIEVDTD